MGKYLKKSGLCQDNVVSMNLLLLTFVSNISARNRDLLLNILQTP